MNEIELASWFTYFDQNYEKFKWFWIMYFPIEYWEKLLDYRTKENQKAMLGMMNDVWFLLPDRFNICDSPPGWTEFLNLIEI